MSSRNPRLSIDLLLSSISTEALETLLSQIEVELKERDFAAEARDEYLEQHDGYAKVQPWKDD